MKQLNTNKPILYTALATLLVALLPGCSALNSYTSPSASVSTSSSANASVEVNAPASKAWAIVGNFQSLSWLAPVHTLSGQGGNAPGATRLIKVKNGEELGETLDAHDAGNMSLSYRITKPNFKILPVQDYSSTISVKSLDSNRSSITWSGNFNPALGLSDAKVSKAINGLYNLGLGDLKKILESK